MNQASTQLSVIIPTYNECRLTYLRQTLQLLAQFENIEVICVDSHSTDETVNLITSSGARWLQVNQKLRSEKMNLGFAAAEANLILFHHPRSLLTREGVEALLALPASVKWGGFRHSFDVQHPLLRFTSWYSNTVRPYVQGIVYLDHCIFARREVLGELPQPLWPEVEIFEDTDFCLKLKRFGRPTLLSHRATTSAIRFQRNGFFCQAILNQLLKAGFYLGLDRGKMNRWYEKWLSLNLNANS